MAEMLSPGVFIEEIDASTIAPSVSSSVCVFAGHFAKGPVDQYVLITSVSELIQVYGLPDDVNYNDWYQCYNALQYGNSLYVSRASNVGGTSTEVSGVTVTGVGGFEVIGSTVIEITGVTTGLTPGALISFTSPPTAIYEITTVTANISFTIERGLEVAVPATNKIYTVIIAKNGTFEAVDTVAATEAVTANNKYLAVYKTILNATDFETKEPSIAFANTTDSKLKIISRSPGGWASDLSIAIALPSAFGNATPSTAFAGIALDELFEYAPTGTQVGIIIKNGANIEEIFTVDFNQAAKDANNKSTYVETVINSQSNLIFVKENTANLDGIKNYLATVNGVAKTTISLVGQLDSAIQADDIANAYDLWNNKEEVDIDIVIGNELDGGQAAFNLADSRKDCIAFFGAYYADVVGKKASEAVTNLKNRRATDTSGIWDNNSMFAVVSGNYKYQYDRYNDKNRWINLAGDIAGLRAQTSSGRASWWASAGLERGQIKNVIKLAFNPTQGQRDLLYKSGINPVVSFPGQGTVMWGQKTLLSKPSSFDRVNVRGLFNTLERSLGKMAKYQVMEFNDNFTRNRIISMIRPFLGSVQAGRGIQDFLVICDTSNNTADVISRNQLIVDVYIKPTYVAEFVLLRFTNAGTNSFSEVIGG